MDMVFEVKPTLMDVLTGFTTETPALARLNLDGTMTLETQVGTIELDAGETQLVWEEFVKRQKRLWPTRGQRDKR